MYPVNLICSFIVIIDELLSTLCSFIFEYKNKLCYANVNFRIFYYRIIKFRNEPIDFFYKI